MKCWLFFFTLDGEDSAWKIFRMAQNAINFECWKEETKEFIKLSDNHIFNTTIYRKI
jgi:hypothetical protein